jgi:excisionase family DNA binding protein
MRMTASSEKARAMATAEQLLETAPIHRRLTSIDSAAESLGISKRKTYQLIAERRLRTVKLGKRHLVVVTSIDEFIAELAKA